MPKDKYKILQIIPAPPGMMALYDDGGKELTEPVVCLALVEYEDEIVGRGVLAMAADDTGMIEACETASNFKGLRIET